MQARFGLAPQLVDRQRIGLDQRGAHGFRGAGKLLDGAVADQFGQSGVAVVAGDAVDRGDDAGEARLGESAYQSRGNAGLQACRYRQADDESGHRNPQRGARNRRSAWRSHLRLADRSPRSNSPEDGFEFLSQLRKPASNKGKRAQRLGGLRPAIAARSFFPLPLWERGRESASRPMDNRLRPKRNGRTLRLLH
jgi:hypothetical protein